MKLCFTSEEKIQGVNKLDLLEQGDFVAEYVKFDPIDPDEDEQQITEFAVYGKLVTYGEDADDVTEQDAIIDVLESAPIILSNDELTAEQFVKVEWKSFNIIKEGIARTENREKAYEAMKEAGLDIKYEDRRNLVLFEGANNDEEIGKWMLEHTYYLTYPFRYHLPPSRWWLRLNVCIDYERAGEIFIQEHVLGDPKIAAIYTKKGFVLEDPFFWDMFVFDEKKREEDDEQ